MEPRVLVVDRDREYSDSLCRRLLNGGYRVTQLHHPRQALQAASLRDYDVAVLDCKLPEIDSERLGAMLGGRIANLEIVVLSDAGDVSPQESRDWCARLQKSSHWADIEHAIDAAVQHRRRRQAGTSQSPAASTTGRR